MQAVARQLVSRETKWQTPPPKPIKPGDRVARVGLARWGREVTGAPFEMSADETSDAHFITYSLKQADVRFSIGHRAVTNGIVKTGRVLLQGPTSARRQSISHESFDFFRVYFSQDILDECFEAIFGKRPASTLALFEAHFVEDRILDSLTQVLAGVDRNGGFLGPCFVDSVGLALTSHLLRLYSFRTPRIKPRVSPLPIWKLRRVRDFIEENLFHPIYLSELSELAGLSRMHFAAQFRAATGQTPHAYLLQRKIKRAQTLLSDQTLSVADVASIVGFKNKAHFASAFKKIVGEPPSRWRSNICW
ncbi:AraC family transcriptional regulator [Bradyrhizobium erythrophlei]|uniref:Transcriptional regulator, AraC family n=1 Tax=Bradyrhizobium erythrophlei TaxID=1437360 RepID=A0A1M5GYU3_9BRAD|nr:AraC family transcriptional regulator [Bradyrhizobium erythrophlei]SHG08890.1 transcriptional regulator, AraC family [Bradyrhizobium erythrophlei]